MSHKKCHTCIDPVNVLAVVARALRWTRKQATITVVNKTQHANQKHFAVKKVEASRSNEQPIYILTDRKQTCFTFPSCPYIPYIYLCQRRKDATLQEELRDKEAALQELQDRHAALALNVGDETERAIAAEREVARRATELATKVALDSSREKTMAAKEEALAAKAETLAEKLGAAPSRETSAARERSLAAREDAMARRAEEMDKDKRDVDAKLKELQDEISALEENVRDEAERADAAEGATEEVTKENAALVRRDMVFAIAVRFSWILPTFLILISRHHSHMIS